MHDSGDDVGGLRRVRSALPRLMNIGATGRQADLLPILRHLVQLLMILKRGEQSLVNAAT